MFPVKILIKINVKKLFSFLKKLNYLFIIYNILLKASLEYFENKIFD